VVSLNDTLVPLDFGGWLQRVFRVLWGNLSFLVGLAAVPGAVFAVYLVVLVSVMPTEAGVQRRVDDIERAASGRSDPVAAFVALFGPMAAVVLIFSLLLVVLGAGFVCVTVFLMVRRVNGQPSTLGQALRFARPRVLRLAGWFALAEVVMTLALGVPMGLGLLLGPGWLAALGALVGFLLLAGVLAVAVSSLVGVVVIERRGLRRAIGLVKGSFWASCGRLAVAGLVAAGYGAAISPISNLATPSMESVTVGTVLSAVVQGVLIVPPLMFVAALCLVSYAELRFQENHGVGTPTLAAELSV
jgi:hypothetical protein